MNSILKKENIYYDVKEELEIIKKYQDLIIYVYNLLKKYPEEELFLLTSDTKCLLLSGLKNLVMAKHSFSKESKGKLLNQVDNDLNLLKILIRVAIKNKYINKRNYTAWSYKITEICNMLRKWILNCQK